MNIKDSTKEVMLKAIDRYAEEYDCSSTECQLMIKATNEDCVPSYLLLIKNKIVKGLSFNEILNLKIDFLGREIIVTPFIASALRKIKKKHNMFFRDINVLIYKPSEKIKEPKLFLFEKTKQIEPITLDYIFGEDLD